MKRIEDKSIDMILCDLPYGTTSCKWDTVIPFEPLWEQYNRVIKDRGAIVLFGSEPFSSALISSNFRGYKYDWVWNKRSVSNPQLAKKQPLKNFETISVFGKGKNGINYFPQGLRKIDTPKVKNTKVSEMEGLKHIKRWGDYKQEYTNYPRAILEYSRPAKPLHPTQKPIALLEYLILTYTLEGEIVLDNCFGSGSTLVAAVNTKRHYIGFELDKTYFEVANERIRKRREAIT